jgi:hypothetical protein
MTDKELAEVYRRNMETLGEQVARLRALVERAQRCLPECYETWHRDAAEALRSPAISPAYRGLGEDRHNHPGQQRQLNHEGGQRQPQADEPGDLPRRTRSRRS